jgi:hypothetical protein
MRTVVPSSVHLHGNHQLPCVSPSGTSHVNHGFRIRISAGFEPHFMISNSFDRVTGHRSVFRYHEHMSESLLFQVREVGPPVDIAIESMTDNQCLDVLINCEKMIAFYEARKARALARFADLRPPSRGGVAVADGAAEEVAVELAMNPVTAAVKISQSRDMVSRLPATVAALEAGEIDYVRAKAMTDLTAVLTESQAQRVERKVLAHGRRANPGRFRQSVRYHVIAVDPGAAERLRKRQRATRDVTGRDLPEGMSQLAITLEPHEAQVAYDQINALAARAKTPGRSLAQCRADVFMDLVMGKQAVRCPVSVNVVVPMTTLMGLNQNPGEITGYGPITAEYARELARDATWRRMIGRPPAGRPGVPSTAPSAATRRVPRPTPPGSRRGRR